MTTKERRRKAISYRYAEFKNIKPTATLEDMVKQALIKLRMIKQRRESLAPQDESPIWRLVGQSKIETGFVHALLARYTPGMASLYLEDDDSATTLAMRAVPVSKTPSGKQQELVEGTLFMSISGNHVVLMQSQSLRSDHVEEHLTWLLRKAGQIHELAEVVLTAKPPKSTLTKALKSPVKSIDLGGALVPAWGNSDGDGGVARSEHAVRDFDLHNDAESSSLILGVLKGLISKDRAAALDLDALNNSNIKYSLHVTYDRSTTKDGQKLLNKLASALRAAEGVEPTVHLKDGTVLTGSDLKLTGHINVDVWNGLPSADEVFGLMKQWLLAKLQNGEVSSAL
ncbi:hypothetical protein [Paucibacter sp. DJ2R-2]|uniref:hypothetical protein n=1 Tax=Paucibacter sp. DJ2R-2 TaxID=2893558 RepID=UPI0021E35AED|nr:hypothetical protein [Paucibacter sp. DJ2R-2]MCV2438186.1 hypothetical protein [Paucibacter sp. DJ2R-2]